MSPQYLLVGKLQNDVEKPEKIGLFAYQIDI